MHRPCLYDESRERVSVYLLRRQTRLLAWSVVHAFCLPTESIDPNNFNVSETCPLNQKRRGLVNELMKSRKSKVQVIQVQVLTYGHNTLHPLN